MSEAALQPVTGQRALSRAWFLPVLAVVCGLVLFTLNGAAMAAPTYPELTGQIVDGANLLSAEAKAKLLAELQALEAKSTDQVAIVTVPSLQGYPIEEYGIGLARKWQIGQQGKDNGVLLIVAPNERKVRIEVGRRLEPVMTDTMSKIIIQNAMLPKFRRGDYAGVIADGVRDIKDVLLGDAEAVKERAKGGRTPKDDPTAIVHLALFFLIVALIVWQMRRAMEAQRRWEASLTPEQRRQLERQRMRRGGGNVIIIPGGSGDWGGGGWGGGDGGGWSGGGGSFGGGGASGDW